MRFHVLRQMIAPHKFFVALHANKTFFARVRSIVTLQLVGARERFAAVRPVAGKRLLARVPAQVSFQVRRFAVDFSAIGIMTNVLSDSGASVVVRTAVRAFAAIASPRWILRLERLFLSLNRMIRSVNLPHENFHVRKHFLLYSVVLLHYRIDAKRMGVFFARGRRRAVTPWLHHRSAADSNWNWNGKSGIARAQSAAKR